MPDRRRHVRKKVEFAMTFRPADGEAVSARCVQLSGGGMFIATTDVPQFGAALDLEFRLEGFDEAVCIPATMRWSNDEGMGVQFGAIGGPETYAITEYLAGID